ALSVMGQDTRPEATHALLGTLTDENDRLVLRVELKDLRSEAPVTQWTGVYGRAQLRYAPVALAGVVSSGLHLPAPAELATISTTAEPLYRQALALTRQDSRIDEALAVLERVIALDPDSALPYAALAEAQWRKYFLLRDTAWSERARQSVDEAEIRNPDCAEVHNIAALLEIYRDRREQAIARLLRATEFPSVNSDPYRRLGAMYQRSGQFPEALQALRKAVALEPAFFRSHQDLASFHLSRGDYAEAAKEYDTAIRLAPDVPQLHALLAACRKSQGRFVEAEAGLRQAIAISPAATTMTELGHVLLYQRKERDAIPWFQRAVAANPKGYYAWVYLGVSLRRAARAAEAKQAFRRALRLVEGDVARNPRSGYERAFLGYLCAETGDAVRAEAEAAQALQSSPANVDAIEVVALTYEAIGKRERALSVLNSAPRPVLENIQRWPDASNLARDKRFLALLASARGSQT
ncbi:MAG TPA: tetratricopeptide repeat protein, partial [Bryobacteraceae bacterium]|nr:tetratricopeptide repeat protein [Bryobacteraceae bacterium]